MQHIKLVWVFGLLALLATTAPTAEAARFWFASGASVF